MKPKFNNRPNDRISYGFYSEHNGIKIRQDYWISRAPAVVGIIFAIGLEGGARVLVIQRSKNMREEPLKFGAPSGYLDWDESGYEGIIREVYEETSLYLPNYKDFLIFDNNEQPFYVQSDPKKDKNQNVSLTYLLVYNFTDHQDFFPKEIENYNDRESAQVKWMTLSEFYNNTLDWAFHHDIRIKTAHEFLIKNNIIK